MVAVGASAGGVEALKSFVSEIPADVPASFVILQHLAPDHESQLADILGRAAKLPVLEADKDMPVEPGRIYVLVPDRYLTLVDHGLFVEPPTEPRGLRMPIDHFMRSLADSAGTRAVGVVLSGTGSDGTNGLRAIKGSGGVTLAQEPESSLYDGMPRAAIDAGVVDQVADLESLARTIAELSARIKEAPSDDPFSPGALSGILALLKARTGHDFTAYKGGTIGRRVRRRMNLLRYDSLPDYLVHLRTNADEVRQLFDDLLINVTSFFRDAPIWDAVANNLLLPLIRNRAKAGEPIRIWVPACSTGEEAFTLAMLMEEQCAHVDHGCEWQIFATDLDSAAIGKGREALYGASIADDVSQERLQRFFQRESGGFRVKKALREKVVFAQQNVLTDPPFSRLDLISCRNLLIYLASQHQGRLLETFHFALREGGYLLLGTSETTSPRQREFRTIDAKSHLYARRPGRSLARLSPRSDMALADGLSGLPRQTPRDRQRDLATQVRGSLLERYAPAAMAVYENGDIAYFHGAVRRFIDQPEGTPSQSIYDLLPPALRSRAREAIKAVSGGGSPSHRSAMIRYPDRDASVCIECVPINDGDTRLFLLTFIETEKDQATDKEAVDADAHYVRQIENELAIVREDLQTTVEELETSNEELKASHEEAVAANEELQSANEELETSREELQSLNEELVTVNNQLEEKIAEVEKSSDDMRNLLTSTRLPVLFLDPEFKISGFTPSTNAVVELRDGDIGRPVSELAFKVDDPSLLDDVRTTLAELSPAEKQITSRAGLTYLRRIHPYRTSDERIHGVVVTYSDITAQAEVAVQLAGRERQQRIIAELGQAALAARDLPTFFNELCASLRVALDCDYAKLLKLNPKTDRLDLVAGAGWKNGLVGKATVPSGVKSQGGYTLKNPAVLVTDFEHERRFDPPRLLSDHGVRSGVSCLIEVGGRPWGVLGLHNREPGHFREKDLTILQAAANVAAATIMQIERETSMARESLMLSLAIKTADMGVWHYDAHTENVTWDERLREIIGVQRAGPNPHVSDFMAMIVPNDRARVSAALSRTVEDGTPFKEEFRLVRADGREIWLIGRGERMHEGDRVSVLGVTTDITERKQAEEQNRFVMRELDHRVKNVLAIILSIAKITGKAAPDFDGFISSFENRLHAMARTHSLLAEARWKGASLKNLVEDELAHSSVGQNVRVEGDEIALAPAAAQAFSMALHELCTNALKYGALSVPDGELDVTWKRIEGDDADGALRFVWTERNGPLVTEPDRKGFGSTVIERILGAQLAAETNIEFAPEGLVVTCLIPVKRLVSGSAGNDPLPTAAAPQIDLTPLNGARVLVLDDEWLVAEQHAHTLIGAGATVVGPFHTVAQARAAIDSEDFDLALLDYNIAGVPVDSLLPQLCEKGVPVLIVSGYGSELEMDMDLDLENGRINYLPKPVSPAAMLGRIARLISTEDGQTDGPA
ncbi:histidine kinase [Novosphingobium malaysiense]|uniref:histidine kinase n=1 Tax=Novosphingobium malaysiense TaxID=1348853 RepID=A0A0B1ZNM7_9SPHN|nr:histidine kinase [Novosphingobium malaysiense]